MLAFSITIRLLLSFPHAREPLPAAVAGRVQVLQDVSISRSMATVGGDQGGDTCGNVLTTPLGVTFSRARAP